MNLLMDLTMQQILARIVGFLLLTAVHGALLAGIARLLGDRGPQYDGRLTLNPLVHLSMPALAIATVLQLGWIKPVPLAPEDLRFGRFGLVLVAAGALLLTLALVPALHLLRPLILQVMPGTGGLTMLGVLVACQDLVLWFVALNILPVPMLTGALFLQAACPALKRHLHRLSGGMAAILVILAVTGVLTFVAAPLLDWLQDLLLG